MASASEADLRHFSCLEFERNTENAKTLSGWHRLSSSMNKHEYLDNFEEKNILLTALYTFNLVSCLNNISIEKEPIYNIKELQIQVCDWLQMWTTYED